LLGQDVIVIQGIANRVLLDRHLGGKLIMAIGDMDQPQDFTGIDSFITRGTMRIAPASLRSKIARMAKIGNRIPDNE
jgi:hypothetical protein